MYRYIYIYVIEFTLICAVCIYIYIYILYNIISWGGVAWIPMRVGGESGAKDFLSDAGKNQVHPASF